MFKTYVWGRIITVLLFIILLMPYQSVNAEKQKGKLILIFLDRVSLTELQNAKTPNIDSLIEKGSIGLMTTNTASSLSQMNEYLTFGCIARAKCRSGSEISLDESEEYKGLSSIGYYKLITGNEKKGIINTKINNIKDINRDARYRLEVGELGTRLRKGGIGLTIAGNCDNDEEKQRYLPLMFMDDTGYVENGIVSSTINMSDPNYPFGIRTDYEYMFSFFKNETENKQVIALQLGDTSRAEEFSRYCSDKQKSIHKKNAIEDADRFIGRVVERVNLEQDRIVLVSPVQPAVEIARSNRLAPVIAAGKDIGKGFLTSMSTRRNGVITNLDFAASILDYFGIAMPAGNSIYTVDDEVNGLRTKTIDSVIKLNTDFINLYSVRPQMLRGFIYYVIAITIASVIIILFFKRLSYILSIFLLSVMEIPFTFIVLPLFTDYSGKYTLVIALGITIFTVMLTTIISKNNIKRILFISTAVVTVLAFDQFTGATLMKSSPLGYDVIAGARFYGIGNEFMGIFIGSASIMAACLVELYGKFTNPMKVAVLGLFLAVFSAIALPFFGANVGGGISSLAAFITGMILLTGRKLNLKRVVIVLFAVALIMFLIFSIGYRLGRLSHIGQTAELIKTEGVKQLIPIFIRKLEMNFKVLKYSIWTKLLVILIISSAVLMYRPVGIFKKTIHDNKYMGRGFAATSGGSIAALFTNDCGIIAATTMLLYVIPPLLILINDRVSRVS